MGKLQINAILMENLQIYDAFPLSLQIYANNYRSMNKVTHLCTMSLKSKTPKATFKVYEQIRK